jgi:hypothetical protein
MNDPSRNNSPDCRPFHILHCHTLMIRRSFSYSIDLTVVARNGSPGPMGWRFPDPIVDSRGATSNSSTAISASHAAAGGLSELDNGQRNKRASKYGSRQVQPIRQARKKTNRSRQVESSKRDVVSSTPAQKVSKRAKILNMMKQSGGATLAEIMVATGWQPHTVRAFVSTLSKVDKIRIRSLKNTNGERVYLISG